MHFSEFGREGLIIQGRERGMAVGRLGVMEKGRGGIRSTRAGTSTMLLLPYLYELLSVSCLLINAINFSSLEGLILICMISFVW